MHPREGPRTFSTLNLGILKVGSITVTLTYCLTGLESACMSTNNFYFYLQNILFQTSKTGGQRYSDLSPLVFHDLTVVLKWRKITEEDFH
jgi:hypothetical protein